MEKNNIFLGIIAVAIIIILAVSVIITDSNNADRNVAYSEFVQCLTDNGALFYGASWCPRCSEQKSLFGKSAKSLPYVECSLDGTSRGGSTPICEKEFITSYPTWRFADGQQCSGLVSIELLAAKSNCELPRVEDDEDGKEETANDLFNKLIIEPAKRNLERQSRNQSIPSGLVPKALEKYEVGTRVEYKNHFGYSVEDTKDPLDVARFLAIQTCVNTEKAKTEEAERIRQFEANQQVLQESIEEEE